MKKMILLSMMVAMLATFEVAAQDPAIQAVVDEVDQQSYTTYQLDIESMGLGFYGGPSYDQGFRNRDGTAGPGSLGNQEARLYLVDKLTAMGLTTSVQGPYLNVVGELTGTVTPEKVYVLGAHYDHLGGDTPGGDDNASGTAGVLEAARILSQYQFESTIRFIAFNAEEDGLLGSIDYVDSLTRQQRRNIEGMINLDMILRPGSDAHPERPIDLELETKTGKFLQFVDIFVQAAADYVPSIAIGDIFNTSDSYSDNDSFAYKNIPSMLAIENSDGDWYAPDQANPYYHTTEDASDRLANNGGSPNGIIYDYPFATDVVRICVALLGQEAVVAGSGTPDTDPPTPNPASFASAPSADSDSAISMTATTGSDASGPVEYLFTETSGNPDGSSSLWQLSTSYTDSGLTASTQYTYTLTMRDSLGNTGSASAGASATTTGGACTPSDMHIDAVVCADVNGCSQGKKYGRATVTILDDCGNPVADALVDVTFTGELNETHLDVATDANGVAVITSTECVKTPTFTVMVDDVTGALPYDSNDNVTVSCSG